MRRAALAACLWLVGCPSGHDEVADTYQPFTIYPDVAGSDTAGDDAADTGGAEDVSGEADAQTDTGTPTCGVQENPCIELVFDTVSGACKPVPANEGLACGIATCVHDVGKCVTGACEPGPPPCQEDDPNGCYTLTCDETTVTCKHVNASDGTPCTGGRWCIDGGCTFAPTCEVPAETWGREYDDDCATNVGCTDVCKPNDCGCWRCDGPFCVEGGCDDTFMLAPGVDIPLHEGWVEQPTGGVVVAPAQNAGASLSPGWSTSPPFDVQLVVSLPGVPSEAAWISGGVPTTVALTDPAIVAVRLVTAAELTVNGPCSSGIQTFVKAAPQALLPIAGDTGTAEFTFTAEEEGITLVALVRVIQDSAGARYYQWVRLGGFEWTSGGAPAEPAQLESIVYAPIPADQVQAFTGVYDGASWKALVDATLPGSP